MSHMPIRILSFGVALIVAERGDSHRVPKEAEVVKSVARAKSLIDSTATNQMASHSLASLTEQDGTITVTLTAASHLDNETFSCYIEGPRPQPYCVRIRGGAAAGEYFIGGYGQSIEKPLANAMAFASKSKRH